MCIYIYTVYRYICAASTIELKLDMSPMIWISFVPNPVESSHDKPHTWL